MKATNDSFAEVMTYCSSLSDYLAAYEVFNGPLNPEQKQSAVNAFRSWCAVWTGSMACSEPT
jgi:hypothetical protein